VFAAYRRAATVEPLVALGIETIELDVTIPESIATAKEQLSTLTGGKLDILVNNAGQGSPRPCTDLEVDTTVKGIFDVNVFGVMRVVQAFVPLLIEAEGTIVNIGSIAPIVPLVFGGAYNASKAALHAYADCLRIELKPFKYV
jgi:1-acylglycerone phosphate reductase